MNKSRRNVKRFLKLPEHYRCVAKFQVLVCNNCRFVEYWIYRYSSKKPGFLTVFAKQNKRESTIKEITRDEFARWVVKSEGGTIQA